VTWNVSIRSLSDRLKLTASDREGTQRRLAYSLSRYSDRLLSVDVAVDLASISGGDDEYHCDIRGEIDGGRPISVTTRGASLEETVSRAADRAARSIDRVILEVSNP
jgi:hypothetical protein